MHVYVGADLGTSGLKLVAVDADGSVVAEAEQAYPVQTPRPGWTEADPQTWVSALRAACESVAPQLRGHRVAGLGIAGQMHGLVLCAADGRPVRPAMLWPDRRAEVALPAWRSLPPQARARLANPLVAGMTGPMLAWAAAAEPDVLASATVALLPKDYVRSVLGGPACTERSDASATLLWDVESDGWATDLVAELGLRGDLLPDVRDSAAVVAEAAWPADDTAARGVPLVVGAADTAAALHAGGGLAPGAVQVNLGSGAQVLCGVDEPKPATDPATHLYADPVGGWYAMAAIRNAGLALDRVRHLLDLTWDDLFGLAETTAPGAGGVSFLPFLSGERGGVAGPSSRGAWLGLDDRTTRAELARAALEGMVFAVRRGVDLVGARPAQVRVSGGGTRSPAVRQALADVLGAELELVPARSASAIGAAMLAAQGAGSALPITSQVTTVVSPGPAPELSVAYERWSERLPSADA